VRAEVAFMNGGRIDGYYYIRIKGTDLIACQDGHPDFPYRFKEGTKDAKKKAKALADDLNRKFRNKGRKVGQLKGPHPYDYEAPDKRG
jgi:hypothetical protein